MNSYLELLNRLLLLLQRCYTRPRRRRMHRMETAGHWQFSPVAAGNMQNRYLERGGGGGELRNKPEPAYTIDELFPKIHTQPQRALSAIAPAECCAVGRPSRFSPVCALFLSAVHDNGKYIPIPRVYLIPLSPPIYISPGTAYRERRWKFMRDARRRGKGEYFDDAARMRRYTKRRETFVFCFCFSRRYRFAFLSFFCCFVLCFLSKIEARPYVAYQPREGRLSTRCKINL